MPTPFFLTEVAQDWDSHNLSVIQEVLYAATAATLDRSNKIEDPLLDTPNLPNLRGVLRWVIVQKMLSNAAADERFNGIQAVWVNLGGVHVLELRGAKTIVTPCHLLESDEAPRESSYRKYTRIENQVNPMLAGFDEPPQENDPLHLLLVHGGRSSTFAYLRAYIDRQNRSIYRQLSNNIMAIPTLLESIDYEPIDEPQIGLNDEGEENEAGENEQ